MTRPNTRTARNVRAALVTAVALVILAVPIAGAATAQEPSPGPIPITPLTGVTSLQATAHIAVDGTVEGKPTQGDLLATLASNDVPSSRIDVSGSLLEPIVARVGGSAVKLFTPSKVSVYAVPDGTYILLDMLLDVCIKPEDSAATAALDQLSPQALMTIVTGPEVAQGTYVGQETLGDVSVEHYLVDGDAFLAAAQASDDPTVSTFAAALSHVSDADLYLSTEGGYPVAYRGAFSGSFAPLAFEGDLQVELMLTGIDQPVQIDLPGRCDHPIPA